MPYGVCLKRRRSSARLSSAAFAGAAHARLWSQDFALAADGLIALRHDLDCALKLLDLVTARSAASRARRRRSSICVRAVLASCSDAEWYDAAAFNLRVGVGHLGSSLARSAACSLEARSGLFEPARTAEPLLSCWLGVRATAQACTCQLVLYGSSSISARHAFRDRPVLSKPLLEECLVSRVRSTPRRPHRGAAVALARRPCASRRDHARRFCGWQGPERAVSRPHSADATPRRASVRPSALFGLLQRGPGVGQPAFKRVWVAVASASAAANSASRCVSRSVAAAACDANSSSAAARAASAARNCWRPALSQAADSAPIRRSCRD